MQDHTLLVESLAQEGVHRMGWHQVFRFHTDSDYEVRHMDWHQVVRIHIDSGWEGRHK